MGYQKNNLRFVQSVDLLTLSLAGCKLMVKVLEDGSCKTLKIFIIYLIDVKKRSKEPIIHKRQENLMLRHLMDNCLRILCLISLAREVWLGDLICLSFRLAVTQKEVIKYIKILIVFASKEILRKEDHQ